MNSTNDKAHSLLPWEHDLFESGLIFKTGRDSYSLRSQQGHVGEIEKKKDIDHIVKCVNAHDDLMSALLRCRTGLQLGLLTSKNRKNDELTINQAEEALKKAGMTL